MRDLFILLVHLLTTAVRLVGPGGLRSVVAESLLVKRQLLILDRARHRVLASWAVGGRNVSSCKTDTCAMVRGAAHPEGSRVFAVISSGHAAE